MAASKAGALEALDGLSLDAFQRKLGTAGTPVAVAFMLPEGKGSKELAGLLRRAAKHYQGQVQFMTCDPDQSPQVAEHYSLEYVPDVLVFDGPDVTERLYGIRSYDELENIVENGVRRARARA